MPTKACNGTSLITHISDEGFLRTTRHNLLPDEYSGLGCSHHSAGELLEAHPDHVGGGAVRIRSVRVVAQIICSNN